MTDHTSNEDRWQRLGEIASKLEGRVKSLDHTYGSVGANQHGRADASYWAGATATMCHYAPDDVYGDPAKLHRLHALLRGLREGDFINEAEYWSLRGSTHGEEKEGNERTSQGR